MSGEIRFPNRPREFDDFCPHCGRVNNLSRTLLDSYVKRRVEVSGWGWSAIAAELMKYGIPTPQGGTKWYASSVRSIYQRLGQVT